MIVVLKLSRICLTMFHQFHQHLAYDSDQATNEFWVRRSKPWRLESEVVMATDKKCNHQVVELSWIESVKSMIFVKNFEPWEDSSLPKRCTDSATVAQPMLRPMPKGTIQSLRPLSARHWSQNSAVTHALWGVTRLPWWQVFFYFFCIGFLKWEAQLWQISDWQHQCHMI